MKVYKSKHFIAWAVTTAFVAALLTTATLVATVSSYRQGIESSLGGKVAITKEGDESNLFIADFNKKSEALNNGNKVVREICDEGMVLLKNENNALPLKAKARVSVFGKNSVNLVYGGSGSAAPKSDVPAKTVFDSLTEAGFEYNPALKAFYEDNSKSGAPRPVTPGFNDDAAILATGESAISRYGSDITSTYDSYGDAAIVLFSRIAGENWDLPRRAADNAEGEDRHYLQLDKNETALLKHVCESGKFKHVIVLFNTSNNIDSGFLKFADDYAYQSKIDAAMLIGSPGGAGIMALGDILSGKVNPSGRTVDTMYTHYENDPTWQNFGDNRVKDGDLFDRRGSDGPYYFVDYEEGIYVGYRYYETRGYNNETWYNKNVVYPFGYGLSYTTFEQQLEGTVSPTLDASKPFKVKVKVKNTGTVEGKEVVQLYATAPYTPDGIEKSYKSLVGFGKTELLKPGASGVVEIEVDPYSLASYDAHDKNGNGFKGYELEKGDYVFHIGKNAHEDFASFTMNLSSGVRYEKDKVTDYKVENLFEQAREHLQEDLSRNDFEATFPKTPTDADRHMSDSLFTKNEDHSSDNPEKFTEMPTTGADITVKFRELMGKSYDDPLWDAFLDQMTVAEMLSLFNEGCYATTDKLFDRLGVPKTVSCDGPTGAVAFAGNPEVYGTCYYCSETLVAQTYNVELATKQGNAIGNECLLGDHEPRSGGASNLPYSGWYAPGVNLHRSPFGGRNTEYYSEDPFISGKMAAFVIKAAQEKGVYANVKHFALNDQETHRSINGVNTFCDEQAIRELYLKPFEYAVKEGGTRGLMTSFNRIGSRWAGGYYNLVTTVLRNEWGFRGSVICDYHTDGYMNNRQMIYAGGDLNLTINKRWDIKNVHADNAGDVTVLRRAAHNNLYALVNSNAMAAEILGYRAPLWEVLIYVMDGVVALGLAAWGFFAIRGALKKKDPSEAAK